jgi:hypothetical protein
MQAEQPEPLLKISLAARQAGLSVFALRRLIKKGKCPSVLVAGIRRVRMSGVRSVIKEVPATTN